MAVSFLAKPVGLLLVGYWAGSRIPVATEYQSLLVMLAVVGGGATALGYLSIGAVAMNSVTVPEIAPMLYAVGYNTVVQALSFAITGFAGAAFAEFRGV